MGYLTMCALSARARRCGSCVLPSPCPRGDLWVSNSEFGR